MKQHLKDKILSMLWFDGLEDRSIKYNVCFSSHKMTETEWEKLLVEIYGSEVNFITTPDDEFTSRCAVIGDYTRKYDDNAVGVVWKKQGWGVSIWLDNDEMGVDPEDYR